MEDRISARLTRAEGREFAFTLGTVLLLLGILALYRGSAGKGGALAAAGLVLFLAGVTAPTRLSPIRRIWMALGRAISRITNPVFMGIIYLGIFAPLGFLRRLFGTNALVHKAGPDGYWIRKEPEGDTIKRLERQY
jgi:hypothetical protein